MATRKRRVPGQSGRTDQVFGSRVDGWFLIVAAAVTTAGIAGVTYARSEHLATFWCVASVAVLGALLWAARSTRYELTSDALVIRSGPFSWILPFDTIQQIRDIRRPFLSPAVSMDRLQVVHRTGAVTISPSAKAPFVAALRAAVPGLVVDGLIRPNPWFALRWTIFAGLVPIAGASLIQHACYVRPPAVVVDASSLRASGGYYSRTISVKDVRAIGMRSTLPRVLRDGPRRVAPWRRTFRGRYTLSGMGDAALFVMADRPPYLLIETTGLPVIINFREPTRTQELYDELVRTWRWQAR